MAWEYLMLRAERFDSSSIDVEQSILSAKGGSHSDLGILLDLYRGYLWTVAAEKLRADLGAKMAPSDLVQETLTKAFQSFEQFRGTTDAELKAWLVIILAGTTTDAQRRFCSQKRDVTREVSLADGYRLAEPLRGISSSESTPSSCFSRSENARRIRAALDALPSDDRQLIELRIFQEMEFPAIAARLKRSVTETRRRWARVIHALAALLESRHDFDSAGPR